MRLIHYLGLSCLTFVIWGCSLEDLPSGKAPMGNLIESLAHPTWLRSAKTIQQVTNSGNRNTIQVVGVVQQQIPLLEKWLYQIEDDSGSLWVLTSSSPPSIGAEVTLKAQVQYESILMQGMDIGEHYALELERLNIVDPIPAETP